MKVTPEVHSRVQATVLYYITVAQDYYKRTFDVPKIVYTNNTSFNGRAYYHKWTVEFSIPILMNNLETFLGRTVPHEVTHLVDFVVNPQNHEIDVYRTSTGKLRRTKRDIHGDDFRFIMGTVFGCDNPSRTFTYENDAPRNVVKYRCTCGCNGIASLGPKQHRKEQLKPGTYQWKGHRARLVLVDTEPLTEQHVVNKTSVPTTGSTKDLARIVFNGGNCSRAEFINKMEQHGVKRTTASTYYQNFYSKMWR